MKSSLNYLFLCIIAFLIVGISLGFSTFPICLMFLLLRLLFSDTHTAGIFLLMYGGVFGGVIRLMYPAIPIFGLMISAMGIILLWGVLQGLFMEDKSSIFFLLLTFLFFGICYLNGPRTDFAITKYTKMLGNGVFMILGYYSIFMSRKYSPIVLAQTLLLASIALISFDISYYHMIPGELFDFNWFRQQELSYFYSNDRVGFLVSYQELGMLAVLGLAIYLSQEEISFKQASLYVVLSSMLIMISSARQAILALFVVLALRLAVFTKRNLNSTENITNKIGALILIVLFFCLVFELLPLLNIDIINSTLQSGDEGRIQLYLESINMFRSNPMFGLGLGGFENYTISDQSWPHNFILEILCETGLIGMVALSLFVYLYLKKREITLLTMTNQRMFYFLIISAVLTSYMFSADFRLSISVFSAFFATQAVASYR